MESRSDLHVVVFYCVPSGKPEHGATKTHSLTLSMTMKSETPRTMIHQWRFYSKQHLSRLSPHSSDIFDFKD